MTNLAIEQRTKGHRLTQRDVTIPRQWDDAFSALEVVPKSKRGHRPPRRSARPRAEQLVEQERDRDRMMAALAKSLDELIEAIRGRQQHKPLGLPIRIAGFTLPAELGDLAHAIAASRSITELSDNWDDEGSVGYDEATWRRAVGFLVSNATRLLEAHGLVLQPCDISPGPHGSIDIHWKTASRELLLNIDPAADRHAHFYGDDGNGQSYIKGDCDPTESALWLMLWISQQ